MSIIGSNILAGASGQGGEYTIEESLRFNASQSSYLSWTPVSAGNRKTWTFSAWVKRGAIGSRNVIFSAQSTNEHTIRFEGDSIQVFRYQSGVGYTWNLVTSSVYRDPSAWYHIVVAYDTTQATASNRVKVFVNGEQVTSFSTANYPAQNSDYSINGAELHTLGKSAAGAIYFDAYLTEVNFIDGQALDPSSFGEFDSVTGVWKPAKYTGTYGTNGFYLPMQLDNTVEGFNTVTYIGTQKPQKISGVGFSPDLVWIKSRNNAQNHTLYDSVRGATKYLMSNSTNAEATDAQTLTSFDTDGFSMGTSFPNDLNYTYVAWCWDAGSSTVSNTDGSITSSVRANPTYGFSVVTYTGTGSAGATVGHGLGVAPSMVIVKQRTDSGTYWNSYHISIGNGSAIDLNTTSAATASSFYWNNTSPTSSVFSISTNGTGYTNVSGKNYVAYCFSEVAGYSKFGSYTGTGASGNTVTTGFKPAFVMIKRTDTTGGWSLFDNTRDPVNPIDVRLQANVSDAENSGSTIEINFNADGFEIDGTASSINASGGTYIYMAFADTREYAYWLDDSGNNNDWQPNGGITTESTVTDTPTPYADGGNYCVLSPIDTTTNIIADLSNGNLKFEGSTSNSRTTWGTFTVNSQKWYFEVSIDFSAAAGSRVGLRGANSGICYRADGQKLENNTSTSYGATWAAGDLIGVAFDCDAQTIEFFKNNVSQGSFSYTNSVDSSNEVKAEVADGSAGNPLDGTVNFGQRPFAYTPPTGFKPLHTGNLPDSAIVDGSKYFDAVLYTGNGSTNNITGVGFQPDFVWLKARSAGGFDHVLQDVIRGSTYQLYTNTTDAEVNDTDAVTSFNSDGFTSGADVTTNNSGTTYVAWNWKANGAGVSNTDGSITSTVSANPTAGFSIVTYTGTGANATVGHSLGTAPSMVVVKNRTTGYLYGWNIYHASLGATKIISFDVNGASTLSSAWNDTSPTSSVFSLGTIVSSNRSGNDYVAYCFADVEGYSKFGSYTGNGSADGPFVYTGFRPAFVMVKQSSASGQSWQIQDSTRETFNDGNRTVLFPDLSNAEITDAFPLDFLSNGFKIRNSGSGNNGSGATHIYMAFAESPFKVSLAR